MMNPVAAKHPAMRPGTLRSARLRRVDTPYTGTTTPRSTLLQILKLAGYLPVPERGRAIGSSFLNANPWGRRLYHEERREVVDVTEDFATFWNVHTQTPGRGTKLTIGEALDKAQKG